MFRKFYKPKIITKNTWEREFCDKIKMEGLEQFAEVANNLALGIPICATFVGVMWGAMRYYYLKAKSDNETAVERVRAEKEAMQARDGIVSSAEYKARLAQAEKLRDEFYARREELADIWLKEKLEGYVEDYIDSIVGSVKGFESRLARDHGLLSG